MLGRRRRRASKQVNGISVGRDGLMRREGGGEGDGHTLFIRPSRRSDDRCREPSLDKLSNLSGLGVISSSTFISVSISLCPSTNARARACSSRTGFKWTANTRVAAAAAAAEAQNRVETEHKTSLRICRATVKRCRWHGSFILNPPAKFSKLSFNSFDIRLASLREGNYRRFSRGAIETIIVNIVS